MKPKYEQPMLVHLVSPSDEAAGYCDNGGTTNRNGCVTGPIIGYASCTRGSLTSGYPGSGHACANGGTTRGDYCSVGSNGSYWRNCQTGGGY
jgi:hypothetical protein